MTHVAPSAVREAARHLGAGGVVAFPTETVYGLGADARNARAVARVFALKGRPAHNPLIVHVASEEGARRLAGQWPDDAAALARRFWPGPLTLVVPGGVGLAQAVTAGGATVAVRCPAHPVALALLEAFDGPLVGPSANRSGHISPTTAAHVRAEFGEADVPVLDGGPCRAGIESTVLWLAGGAARVLRPGVIGADELSAALGRVVESSGGAPVAAPTPGAALPSPGMLARHYAPSMPARLFDSDEWPEVLESLDAQGRRAAVLTHERSRVAPAPHQIVRMPLDAAGYAARLYAALREGEASGATAILIELPRAGGAVWDAVRDRLARACAVEGLGDRAPG